MRQANKTPGVRLRVVLEPDIAIGPGKADLLEGIAATGSIAEAGRRMRMSYKRAWLLVETMNRCFQEPLVETAKGGARGGGARLTATGERVLATYRRMQQRAASAVDEDLVALRSLLSDMSDGK